MARYIDAEEITRRIVYYYGHTNEGSGERYAYGIALKEVERTPTADVVEVRHGHWIWLEGNLYECSECPAKTEVDEKMNEPLYQFCPYCGARMDGKQVKG